VPFAQHVSAEMALIDKVSICDFDGPGQSAGSSNI
jgi:hypothetical protein